MKKELCLVIPVYNESAAIKNVLQSWEDYLRACLETHLSIMKRFNSMLAMAI